MNNMIAVRINNCLISLFKHAWRDAHTCMTRAGNEKASKAAVENHPSRNIDYTKYAGRKISKFQWSEIQILNLVDEEIS